MMTSILSKLNSLDRDSAWAECFAGRILRLGGALAGLLSFGSMPVRADDGWLPENISTFGGEIDHQFWLIFWITAVTFFITMAILVYSMVKFRYKEGRKAQFIHGSHKLEVAWTLVPALILLFIALYQTKTWAKIKMDIPTGPENVSVQVFAKQFEWNFRTPGNDGEFGTSDDICSINDLTIPVDTNIVFQMRSLDVIHSLFLPHFRFKQDIMPGMTINTWVNSVKTTDTARTERSDDGFNYEIACTELCGLGHHEMRGRVIILSQAEYSGWAKKKSDEAADFDLPEIWSDWDRAGGLIELPDLHDHGEDAEEDDEWGDDEWDDEE